MGNYALSRGVSALCSRAACGRATAECMGSNGYAPLSCTGILRRRFGRGTGAVEIIDNISKRLFDELKTSLKMGGHLNGPNDIKYYVQELKENMYNLTRMNLVMRGILPVNIEVRNGDTLERDWPFFDEANPDVTYESLFVDAVISNRPYSQHWSPDIRDGERCITNNSF